MALKVSKTSHTREQSLILQVHTLKTLLEEQL